MWMPTFNIKCPPKYIYPDWQANYTKYHELEVMWQEWISSFIVLCNKHAPNKKIRASLGLTRM